MVKNGLKLDFRKIQNLDKNDQNAWAIAHENAQNGLKFVQKKSKFDKKSTKSKGQS